MRKSTLNYLVDGLTSIMVFGVIATGLVMRFTLPPGSGGRHGIGGRHLVLWGMDRHTWGELHFWLAVVMAGLFVIHLALHWTWVCNTTQRILRPGRQDTIASTTRLSSLYGAVLLVAIVAMFVVFLWVAHANVQSMDGVRHEMLPHSSGVTHSERERIRGNMTLGEVEAVMGIPTSVLKHELGLPESVTSDQRLGQLRRQYGFEMSTVRDIVDRYESTVPAGVETD